MNIPVRKTKCATCPFRPGSPYAHLKTYLAVAGLSESRICHSTGSNGIHKRTGIKDHLCRGSRDVQLETMTTMGVIEEATDEAWNDQRAQIGMKRILVKDPEKGGKS